MSLVGRVKTLCQQHEISIPKLEKELEFSSGSIYKWDANDPGIDKVKKVAEYFNVSIDFLLYGEKKSEAKPEPFNKESILKLAKLNGASIGQVIAVLEEVRTTIFDEITI